MRLRLGQWILALYRWAAVILLYGVLGGVVGYVGYVGFYAVSSSWVAPTRISPSNDHILSLTSQLVASKSQMNSLLVANTTILKTREENQLRRSILLSLVNQLDAALLRTRAANVSNGSQLSSLAEDKKSDLTAQQELVSTYQTMSDAIDRDFKAGLITRAEALSQKAAINTYRNSYTDGRVNEVVIRENARQKLSNDDMAAVDALAKKVEVQGEISAINLATATGTDQYQTNQAQIEVLKKAIATTSDSPYFLVANSDKVMYFAFVPYENQRGVEAGSSIYDCYLSMIACHQVGTVVKVFADEEHISNPIFKTEMRGFLIQMSLTDTSAAKSKTLFINRKPLLF